MRKRGVAVASFGGRRGGNAPQDGRGSDEAYIFAAIQSAGVMFVVADSIESFDKTENIWCRFIAEDGKKIQVLHKGLDESKFPFRLRRIIQRQEPINLNSLQWLELAKKFAKKPEKNAVASVSAQAEERSKYYDADYIRSIANSGRAASSLPEATVMLLSRCASGDADGASYILREQFVNLGGGEIVLIAELCVGLARLAKSAPSERAHYIDNVRNIGDRIKRGIPALTQLERDVYSEVKNADLLIYLAKCFGVIKDRDRQCFVLDRIDYREIYDTRTVNDLVQMLLANDRTEEVSEVLRGVSRLDGNTVLLSFLKGYKGNVKKAMLLYAIADKMNCTSAIEDDLNRYLSECDDTGVALAVVNIMNRNHITVSPLGLNGALSKIKDATSVKILLDNFGTRGLSGVEVDKLVSIGADGGDEVANEVLRHLHYKSGVNDLGSYNMQQLLDKCNLEKIKIAFFEYNIDKKLAENLLLGTIKGDGVDRLATVSVLIGSVTSVDIASYEKLLLGTDPLKKDLVRLLAPKTGKYASANRVFEAFFKGRDKDADKREIFAMYPADFPFNDTVIELYLNILPERYDDLYKKLLFDFVKRNPGRAREFFVRHYEALVEGYEEVLDKIVANIRTMDDNAIVRFVSEFKGSQAVKDRLFLQIIPFSEKPKKITVTTKTLQCNLAQAYLFTLREAAPSVKDVLFYLHKKGADPDDKLVVHGKKVKFKEFVSGDEVSSHTREMIASYVKL